MRTFEKDLQTLMRAAKLQLGDYYFLRDLIKKKRKVVRMSWNETNKLFYYQIDYTYKERKSYQKWKSYHIVLASYIDIKLITTFIRQYGVFY